MKQLQSLKNKLKASGDSDPRSVEEAISLANCATFIRFLYLPETQTRSNQVFSQELLTEFVPKLKDAQQQFLISIVPVDREIDDHVLSCLSDLSTQVYIYRLRRNVGDLETELTKDQVKLMAEEDQKTIFSSDILDALKDRSQSERNLSRLDLEDKKKVYESFCNIRLSEMEKCTDPEDYYRVIDWEALARRFPLHSNSKQTETEDPPTAKKLGRYVLSVLTDIEDNLPDTSLIGYKNTLNELRNVEPSSSSSGRKRSRDEDEDQEVEDQEEEQEEDDFAESELGRSGAEEGTDDDGE